MLVAAFAAMSLASGASAAGETASLDARLDPRGKTFFKQATRPGNLSIQTQISVPPGSPTIEPLKRANLRLPRTVNFQPKRNMPVCPDSKVNSTTVSVPVPTIVAACPKSIIGNGTATFALAQSTNLARDGVIVLFNGGRQNGLPRVKLYAYSYDTEVGLYTEAVLRKNGGLNFPVPPLTADSSVTSINLDIPGSPKSVDFPSKGITANLPAGQDKRYVQARCNTNSFDFSGTFLLGQRPEGLEPGPTTTLNDSASYACTGALGSPNLRTKKVKGPKNLRRGQTRVYRVKVKNVGTRFAKRVKIGVRGKWVRSRNQRAGQIAPGRTRTFKVKAGLQGRAKSGKRTVIKFRTKAKDAKVTVGKIRVRVR